MIDRAAGVSSAAPTPCTARETISASGEFAKPLASDAAVNVTRPARKTDRRSRRSAIRPPSSRRPPVNRT
jgi:hypothetical protein